MNSPLGKYAQLVAAIIAVTIILAWIVGEYLNALGITATNPSALKEVALIAVGAVFGATAAVNGVKPAIEAADHKAQLAHNRLDAEGAQHSPGYTPEIEP